MPLLVVEGFGVVDSHHISPAGDRQQYSQIEQTNLSPNAHHTRFIPSSSAMPHDFGNSSTADIILRSGGPGVVEFMAHRVILSIASPIFETMFSLPQPGAEKTLPVCDLSEDANTLEALLRFIYPIEE